ncbi:hypothetical protein RZS08_32270, partial [Arthrospira platensis SPKY1]|nr:hypothetical protein [Arthrospira platensis SPKY1]
MSALTVGGVKMKAVNAMFADNNSDFNKIIKEAAKIERQFSQSLYIRIRNAYGGNSPLEIRALK